MNNNYFYKLASIADRIDWMRKVAQSTGSTTQEPTGTSTTTPTPSTPNTTASTTSTPGATAQTTTASAPQSTPVRSPGPGDEKFVPKNATELYNHWVKQKENFYRKRAEDPNDKFGSRYANYTVSREAQKGLEREAKDLFDRFNRRDINQADLERYFTREGAFNSAMDRDKRKRIERKQKQEQAAGAPMQNPTDSAAIQNLAQPTWTNEDQRFQQASQAYNNTWWNYYNPDPQSQQGRDFRLQRASALRPYYPQSYRDSQIAQGWWDDLGVRGMQSSPDADIVMLERAMQQAYNWNQYAKSMPANTPQLQAQDRQNQALWNLMQRTDGKLRTPQELADYINTSGVSTADLDPQIHNILQNRLPNITL